LKEHRCVPLETQAARLKPFVGREKLQGILGQAARLPFHKKTFDTILSFETLFAVRPPWTTIAEFHRVLVPDGKLVLIEPQSLGFFSSMRDKVSGPGKRVFPLDEIKYRLARADWQVGEVRESVSLPEFPRPVYALAAIKKDNPVEPVPQYTTAQELIARRKTFPKGEELP
jgi:SAM-dependent methyltransferase